MENSELRYWKCMIGPINKGTYMGQSDTALRDSIKGRFFSFFNKHADKCISSWAVTEEKFELLREIECYSEDELRQVLTELKAY